MGRTPSCHSSVWPWTSNLQVLLISCRLYHVNVLSSISLLSCGINSLPIVSSTLVSPTHQLVLLSLQLHNANDAASRACHVTLDAVDCTLG